MTLRHSLLLPTPVILAVGLLFPAAAAAQDENFEQIVTIMRACSQIDDVMARVACYDNNINPRSTASGEIAPAPSRASTAPAPSRTTRDDQDGFGAEMLPEVRAEQQANRPDEVEVRVASSQMVAPGIYVFTMDDGAQWRLTDSASMTYEPPREGDTVRLARGVLGSVFLHFDNQGGLRARRIR